MRRVPIVLAIVAVVFNLWTLRAERLPVAQVNDGAMHTQMIRWAADRIDDGHIPLDGWYPYLALGSAQFHHYPSLPHILMGPLALGVDAEALYPFSIYVLLALWPLAVYLGARGFGWDPLAAACSALIAPLISSVPGYGFEYESYTWQGLGVYSQLWGMVFLPIAWRAGWRGLERGGGAMVGAAAASAFVIALNFQTGYLVLACIAAWALLVDRGEPRARLLVAIRTRAIRWATVTVGAAVAAAWVLVPLLADRAWTNRSPEFADHFWLDSFGAQKVLSWLVRGELLDGTRLPAISLLVLVGVIALVRTHEDRRGAAAVGMAGAVSLFLFIGRVTWGPLMDLLPGGSDLMLHRFLGGFQLAAVMCAGAGLAFLVRSAVGQPISKARFGRAVPVVALALAAIAIVIPMLERVGYHERGAGWIADQRVADATDGEDLSRLLAAAGKDGRVYGGSRVNWGTDYKVGSVPIYSELANHDLDAIGFTYRTISSLSSDIEPLFDETRLSHHALLGVRYLVLPTNRPPSVEAGLISTVGRHSLWSVNTSGYLEMVDTAGVVSADRTSIRAAASGFLASDDALRKVYPVVSYDGLPSAPSTLTGNGGSPGEVLESVALPDEGLFVARVRADRPGVLVLKSSFHPRWTATMDGDPEDIFMVAPSFIGVRVPPGEHVIELRYVPFQHYGLLFLLAAGALGVLSAATGLFAGFRRRTFLFRGGTGGRGDPV